MNIKYKVFATLFNFFRIFPLKSDNVFFIKDKKFDSGNFDFIKKEFDRRENFQYNSLSKDEYSLDKSNSLFKYIFETLKIFSFFIIKSYKLARSKYIFLNDNFFPMAYMNFNKEVIIVQLWHAPGAFKRFGLSVIGDNNVKNLIKLSNSKVKYITVTSKNVSKYYEEAFAVNNNKILALGIPRMDYYFDKKYNSKYKIKNIKKNFPEIEGKKIVLYTPTFREDEKRNKNISDNFDFKLFTEVLGEEYVLFFRSHPKINTKKNEYSIDVTNYEDVKELLLIADILITDYSSIMVEYAVLSKPIIFYPFDLEYYSNEERGFYFDYKNVPGQIANNTEDIIEIIKNEKFDYGKIKHFVNNSYDFLDDKSSKRIVDYILHSKV